MISLASLHTLLLRLVVKVRGIIMCLFIAENEGSPSSTPTQQAISRKKKPKRRSTGVVNIDMDVSY